jgi:hypothetical protein
MQKVYYPSLSGILTHVNAANAGRLNPTAPSAAICRPKDSSSQTPKTRLTTSLAAAKHNPIARPARVEGIRGKQAVYPDSCLNFSTLSQCPPGPASVKRWKQKENGRSSNAEPPANHGTGSARDALQRLQENTHHIFQIDLLRHDAVGFRPHPPQALRI